MWPFKRNKKKSEPVVDGPIGVGTAEVESENIEDVIDEDGNVKL